MIALLIRELRVAARRPLMAAVALQTALLALFVAGWGTGHPLDAPTFSVVFRNTQLVLLMVFLPWIASRCAADDGRNGFVHLSLIAGASPGELIVARLVTIATAMLFAVAATLPLAILAGRMAPSSSGILFDQSMSAVFALTAGLLTVAVQLSLSRRRRASVAGWLAATIATSVIAVAMARAATPASKLLVIGVAIVWASALLVMTIRRRLVYLEDAER